MAPTRHWTLTCRWLCEYIIKAEPFGQRRANINTLTSPLETDIHLSGDETSESCAPLPLKALGRTPGGEGGGATDIRPAAWGVGWHAAWLSLNSSLLMHGEDQAAVV